MQLGSALISWCTVSNTANLKECLTLLNLGGAASGITEGEDKVNRTGTLDRLLAYAGHLATSSVFPQCSSHEGGGAE